MGEPAVICFMGVAHAGTRRLSKSRCVTHDLRALPCWDLISMAGPTLAHVFHEPPCLNYLDSDIYAAPWLPFFSHRFS